MRRKLQLPPRIQHLAYVLAFAMLALGLWGCPPSVPTEGVFPIKVIALTSDKVGIPNAKIIINGKLLGKTDQFGTFFGTYRGKVRTKIKIKVEGPGPDNYMIMTSRLRLRKTPHGLAPKEIKVEAFLRSAADVGLGTTTPKTAAPAETPSTETPPTTVAKVEPRTPAPRAIEPTPRSAPIKPQPTAPVVDITNHGTPTAAPTETATPPAAIEPKPAPRKRRTLYIIKATSNVPNVYVYKNYRRIGLIPDAGGTLRIEHRDRRKHPRPVTIKFRAKDRYLYLKRTIKQRIELNPDQEEYSVEANFEKRPPIKITVTTNAEGAKARMNGKRSTEKILSADQAATFEYVGRPRRRIRIDIYSPNRKIRPRRIRRYVRIKKGTYEYSVEAKFRLPKPVIRRTPPPSNDLLGGGLTGGTNAGGDNGGMMMGGGMDTGTPPPPEEKKFSGVYKIIVTSNVGNVRVYRGRRYVGKIRDDGGSLEITYKNKRKKVRPLKITLKARNRYAYKVAKLTQRVDLEYGRAEYRLNFEFEKRPPIKIMVKANVAGAKIKMNRKPVGEIVDPAQAVPIEYTGRPTRRIRIEVLAPNAQYRPRRVRKTVRIKKGIYEYSVNAEFQEHIRDIVITPRCFRRARRKRIVLLLAPPRTSFYLKGDCGESAGMANKKGRLRVKMPVDSFQRVVATFANGTKREKIIEVKRGRSDLRISFNPVGKGCNLTRIMKKIQNKIFLEEEEVTCLRKVAKSNPQFFSAKLALSRFYCQKKAYLNGKKILDHLYRNPRNKFNPYNAMQMGIEYGRCKRYRRALYLLKSAVRMRNRFVPADKYRNSKALFKALATIYEQKYYKQKNLSDLRLAVKSYERLVEIIRAGDTGEMRWAKKELQRIKGILAQRGGLDE